MSFDFAAAASYCAFKRVAAGPNVNRFPSFSQVSPSLANWLQKREWLLAVMVRVLEHVCPWSRCVRFVRHRALCALVRISVRTLLWVTHLQSFQALVLPQCIYDASDGVPVSVDRHVFSDSCCPERELLQETSVRIAGGRSVDISWV